MTKTHREAWGIIEDGELWDTAYQTREDAFRDLAESVCELSNGQKKSKEEWICRIVRVQIKLPDMGAHSSRDAVQGEK